MSKRTLVIALLLSAAAILSGCGMVGKTFQATGGAFNKVGGAVGSLGS